MSASSPPDPHWPARLAALQAELRLPAPPATRQRLRGELWSLLAQSMLRVLHGHARRAGRGADAEVEDIAAEKALEMLARAESGAWDLSGRSPGEIVKYVSNAARNGWLDHVSRSRREIPHAGFQEDIAGAEDPIRSSGDRVDGFAEGRAEAAELASALRECLGQMAGREQRVWFFRAYYEMSSREIAAHPLVRLQPAHVDVINQRVRDRLRRCMQGKGHDLVGVPGEAFVRIWEVLDDLARAAAAEPLADRPTRSRA